MTKNILILSGGLDSVTLLYDLYNQKYNLHCLIFDYGQKARKEIEYAINHCNNLNIKYNIIDMKSISNIIWNNTLINNDVYDLNPTSTDIPSRNTIFIEIASAYAITWGYDNIYLGLIKSEEIYMLDITKNFIDKINELHKVNNWKNINVKTPYINYTKEDVIKKALELNVPLNETWSCYYNEKDECGKCNSCISKNKAFEKLKIKV